MMKLLPFTSFFHHHNHHHYQFLLRIVGPNSSSLRRHLSKSTTSLPRKPNRVRDHAFDNIMEIQKKLRRALKLQQIIVSEPTQSLPVPRLSSLAHRQLSLRPDDISSFLLRHPHVFHVFLHPVHRALWCRLTPRALHLHVHEEPSAIQFLLPDTILRLRKLLMLSSSGRLRLDHIRLARRDLALPDDFERSVLLANPHYFRLVTDPHDGSRYAEIVHCRDSPDLAVCAIERAREREYRVRGRDAENLRFAFLIDFPPGFKIGKYLRLALWKWQRVPYWSPYEDVGGYDMRSIEAQKRMEKRAVAVMHELLSLMVEKRTTIERIAPFKEALGLPKKLKEFLLMYQGIFYVSTRGNQGKLHTVFLREAFRKGELLEPNAVSMARKELGELLLLSPKLVNLEHELTSLGSGWDVKSRTEEVRGSDAGSGDEAREGDGGSGEEGVVSSDSGVESECCD